MPCALFARGGDIARAVLCDMAQTTLQSRPELRIRALEHSDARYAALMRLAMHHEALGLAPSEHERPAVGMALRYQERQKRHCGARRAPNAQQERLEAAADIIERVLGQVKTYRQEAVQRVMTMLMVSASVHHLVGDIFFQQRAWFVKRFPFLADYNPWVALCVGRRMGKSAGTGHVAAAIALQKPGISVGILGNSLRVTLILLGYLYNNIMGYLNDPGARLPPDPRTGQPVRPEDIEIRYNRNSHIKIIFPWGTISSLHAYPCNPDVRVCAPESRRTRRELLQRSARARVHAWRRPRPRLMQTPSTPDRWPRTRTPRTSRRPRCRCAAGRGAAGAARGVCRGACSARSSSVC